MVKNEVVEVGNIIVSMNHSVGNGVIYQVRTYYCSRIFNNKRYIEKIMKKSVLMGLAAIASLGFAACNSSNASSNVAQSKKGGDKEVLYSGILPAADAQGTIYTLKLEFDDDHNYTDGDYMMVENTVVSDTTVVSGLKEVATSYTKGDFRKESKQVNGVTIDYIRLYPDAKDALGTASAGSTYFVINPDGSLTMTGADLQKAANTEMNYTLTVK